MLQSDTIIYTHSREHGLHGPEESRGLLKEELLLSLLVPSSERDRRDVSGLAAIASQITVHV